MDSNHQAEERSFYVTTMSITGAKGSFVFATEDRDIVV
jgi:hypothetical protein